VSGSVAKRLSRDCALRDVRQVFCDAHAEDEEWHPSMLPPGEEGGAA